MSDFRYVKFDEEGGDPRQGETIASTEHPQGRPAPGQNLNDRRINLQSSVNIQPKPHGVCPGCGTCNTCGRPKPTPPNPWWYPRPYYPHWYGSSSVGGPYPRSGTVGPTSYNR